jgi:signal transduction histidine kinase
MKGQFVSLVTHEFRTPLGVIMSAVEVLQRYFERLTPEKRVHHLATIFRSTKNLSALIDEVLLLGRVEEALATAPTMKKGAPADLLRAHLRLVTARTSTLEEAARVLGIDAATIYRKRKRWAGEPAATTAS